MPSNSPVKLFLLALLAIPIVDIFVANYGSGGRAYLTFWLAAFLATGAFGYLFIRTLHRR